MGRDLSKHLAVSLAAAAELLLLAAFCGLVHARNERGAPGAPPPPLAAPRLVRPAPPRHLAAFLAPLPPIPPLHDAAPAEGGAYRLLLRRAASRHLLPPSLVEAVARVESDFNPREVSEKGALGLMQVMPETGARFGVPRHELFDPERNAAAGTAYLAWLMDRYRGDLDRVLAAYNAGEGAVDKYGGIPPYAETREYVRRVRAILARPD